jgi:hypothetical protein
VAFCNPAVVNRATLRPSASFDCPPKQTLHAPGAPSLKIKLRACQMVGRAGTSHAYLRHEAAQRGPRKRG